MLAPATAPRLEVRAYKPRCVTIAALQEKGSLSISSTECTKSSAQTQSQSPKLPVLCVVTKVDAAKQNNSAGSETNSEFSLLKVLAAATAGLGRHLESIGVKFHVVSETDAKFGVEWLAEQCEAG